MVQRSYLWLHRLVAVFVSLLGLDTLSAQVPPPLPAQGPAPLLYARFSGPAGMHVTLYQGAAGQEFVAPVNAGFRPGYIYRVRLSELPGLPGVELFPTLEVRGTLQLPSKLRAADYPAPVTISTEDIERALSGSMLTKVVYLENPENAIPLPTVPDQPFESAVRTGEDPVAEARAHGRPVLIVRLGGRAFSPEELVHGAIAGTVLMTGAKVLPPAAVKPWVPWAHVPVYDPFLGPKPPEEECLHDGGDLGLRAGFDRTGRLQGLEPADTVAEYTDSRQQRHVSPSNRVCICVPRFAVIRAETNLINYYTLAGPQGAQAVQEQFQARIRIPSLLAQREEQLAALRSRQRASATVVNQAADRLVRVEVLNAYDVEVGLGAVLGTNAVETLTIEQRARLIRQLELARLLSQPASTRTAEQVERGPEVVGRLQGVNVLATLQDTRDVTVCCNEAPQPPDKPLVLYKWADKQAAQVGDVVTFHLKYSNVGGKPITDVAVSDSLIGRLEYVPGSARSDRDAVVTMQPNEAGSVILRWEIGGRLLPGQSGIVTFQARIR